MTEGVKVDGGAADNAILSFFSSVPSEIPFAGLIVLVIVALVRGWLIPRSHLVDLRADYAKQMEDKQREIEAVRADRDARLREVREDRESRLAEVREEMRDWKEAAQSNEAALAVVRAQNGELLEVARTAEHVLRATFGTPAPRQIGEADA